MTLITETNIEAIARGSAVLASGGGGDPLRGRLAVEVALRQHGPVTLLDIDDIPGETLVMSTFLIGAPIALLEKFPFGEELVRAARRLERHHGSQVSGIFSVEAGGVNSMVPFAVAARMGLPVLDADTMGRAYPEMDLTLVHVAGLPTAPVVITDDYGSLITIEASNAESVERLSRTISARSGAAVAAAAMLNDIGTLRPGLVAGSISTALRIGTALLTGASDPTTTWDEILQQSDGLRVFEGKVSSTRQDIQDGWGVGHATVDGTGDWSGSQLTIDVINEYLAASVDGEPVAVTPDIIAVYDANSGLPITSEGLRYGYRVGVVALPSDPRWKTARGLALGGPRRFGYDFDYRPFARPVGHKGDE